MIYLTNSVSLRGCVHFRWLKTMIMGGERRNKMNEILLLLLPLIMIPNALSEEFNLIRVTLE